MAGGAAGQTAPAAPIDPPGAHPPAARPAPDAGPSNGGISRNSRCRQRHPASPASGLWLNPTAPPFARAAPVSVPGIAMNRRHFLRTLSLTAMALAGGAGFADARAQQPAPGGPPSAPPSRPPPGPTPGERPPMRPQPGRPSYPGSPHRPPPPRRHDRRPPPPYRRGYVWVDGYWSWHDGRYIWMPGRWIAQRPGHRWVPGYWRQQGQVWIFVDGRWR